MRGLTGRLGACIMRRARPLTLMALLCAESSTSCSISFHAAEPRRDEVIDALEDGNAGAGAVFVEEGIISGLYSAILTA